MLNRLYSYRYERALRRLGAGTERSLRPYEGLSADPDWLRVRLSETLPARVRRVQISLGDPAIAEPATSYWRRFGEHYRRIGFPREKALEHALTFSLLDFSRVRRYCDVAADRSPIGRAVQRDWPATEHWKQDLRFWTHRRRRRIGGPAQQMRAVEDGFFDAMSLHCAFEHFHGEADTALLPELDRVLGPTGACLILPLYLDRQPSIHFDPTRVTARALAGYDVEAELRPRARLWERHARFYSPESLATRVLGRLPVTLEATLLEFRDGARFDPGVYLDFGLVLHRAASVFTR